MKINNLILLFAAWALLLPGLNCLACITADSEPETPMGVAAGLIFGMLSLVTLVCVIFSPYIVFLEYVKHGGKKKYLAWPAFGIPLAVLVSFLLGFWILIPFSLLYLFLAPFVSIILYRKIGGKKKYWYWGVLLIFWAVVIKGMVSLTLGCG